MTYQDVSVCNALLSAIPLADMPSNAVADIILLQVEYQRKYEQFQDFMQSVLANLTKDGIRDKLSDYIRYNNIINSDKRTEEDGDFVKAHKEELDKFKPEYECFEKSYNEAYNKKLREDAGAFKKLSRKSYEEIIGHIGLNGNIEVSFRPNEPQQISKIDYIKLLGYHVVTDV